jgi:DNA-binding Lrp family transcriptional regulator
MAAKTKIIHAYVPDKIDNKILNVLLMNSKTTNREMASRIGVAVGTINTRIKKLEKEKIILRYSVDVDYEKLGYNIEVLIGLKLKKGSFYEVMKELAAEKNVFLAIDITGDYDAELLARFKTRRQLDTFVKNLQQQPHIEYTRTRLILNIYRERMVE